MKLLLVVGLAAVVIVILIAVFLSVRLGRGDEHEEAVRPGSRDRGRREDEDSRWRDAEARDPRPVMASSRAGGSGRRGRDEADASPYRDRGERRPSREQLARGQERDYDYPDRRDTGPSEHPSSPRQVAASRDYRGPASGRHDQRTRQPDYPDHPSGPQRGYTDGDYHSGPLAAADYPSADYPSMDFPSGPLAAADYPSADYPSMDFPSGPLAAADYPSGDYPAAAASAQPASRGRSKPAPGKNGSGRGQPESRRKAAKTQSPAKGRSRSRRDDDDWPSTEWDKLTDEQYWAELSSDKPLSATARTAQAASEPVPAAGNGKSRPANGQPAASPGASAPMPAGEPTRELPSRRAPSPPREPVTERLPVRARPQPPAAARSGNGSPAASQPEVSLSRPAEEPSLALLSSLATSPPTRPYGALDEDPLTSPSFARPALDSRSYQRPGGPPANSGAHLQPAVTPAGASHGTPGYGAPSYHPDGYQPGREYAGPAYPARDFGNSGPHSALPASPPTDGYQPPGQAGPGYAYSPTGPGTWHRPPDEPVPTQGNPYGSYVDPVPASYQGGPAAYADSHLSGGHAYPADLAGSYPGPGSSQEPAPYQPAIAAVTPSADAGHYAVAGAYPQAGYPGDGGYGYQQQAGQAGYADPREATGYPPGYANGYPADPYEDNGYGYRVPQG